MILFALKVLLRGYPLKPRPDFEGVALATPMLEAIDLDFLRPGGVGDLDTHWWPDQKKTLEGLLKLTAEAIVSKVIENLPDRLTSSGTFGPNDPFTLCWILEAVDIAALAQRDPILTICAARADEALNRPDSFRIGTVDDNDAAGHALPLLRGLHLHQLVQRHGGRSGTNLRTIRKWFEDRVHQTSFIFGHTRQ